MKELMTHIARNRRAAHRWGAGIAAAALVAAGGGYAAANLAGSTSPDATGIAGTLTAQATDLNTALSSAATNTPRGRRALARLRRLPGMYGQFSVRTKKHGTRTIAYERGVVTATGGTVTIRAANGTEWSWQLTSHTVVREGGSKVGTSGLAAGEHVFAGGQLSGSTRDARLILIGRGPRGSTQHAAPAPSTSQSPSASGATTS
ncbi:MAG TPA: hypothetical protein VKV80_10135 [Streptosporangiaceae bacterium]|nr:hypothetical protein [Streptosporangiaceae bacterium]